MWPTSWYMATRWMNWCGRSSSACPASVRRVRIPGRHGPGRKPRRAREAHAGKAFNRRFRRLPYWTANLEFRYRQENVPHEQGHRTPRRTDPGTAGALQATDQRPGDFLAHGDFLGAADHLLPRHL